MRRLENLEAADHLLEHGFGVFSNAAASRAYYAAYLAVADAAQRDGRGFDGKHEYYKYDQLPDNAQYWGLVSSDEKEALRLLYSTRVKADYWEEGVEIEEAELVSQFARTLVEKLVGGSA